jgi:hypothetical protein
MIALRFRRNGGLDFGRVNALRQRVAIYKHRGRSGNPDGLGRGEEGVRDA